MSKKHGQLKQATTKMVQVSMGFIDDSPNADAKLSLIDTLRTVTEGKVWYMTVVSVRHPNGVIDFR
jgi:26S proteasome regulatory subunit N5